MSLKNDLIRSSALNGVQTIVTVVVTLLIMPFIIHHLGDHIDGYGFGSFVGSLADLLRWKG